MNKGAIALFWTATAALVAAPALAQQTGGGFGFSNSGGPVDITADHNENFQQQHLSIWSGHVVAIQGQNTLQTPRLQVFFDDSGQKGGPTPSDGGRIRRMEADGPVYFVTPTQKATGKHAVYEAVSDTVTLTGDVILVQDKNVVKGEKLVIEQKTGHSTLYAGQTGATGRVRGVFYQNQADAPAKPGAPAAPKPQPQPKKP
jgi:lipopolysaccharide export system protein LptA